MPSLILLSMNKTGILFLFLIYFLIQSVGHSQGETSKPEQLLTGEELANYEKQARQLVGFMEFAFNTLGSADAEYKDKHTIIEQSYLKFFKNDKVQVEDDLVEKRDMVTNKDVQAYLKDIDFFFKSVTFKYTIEEITQEINEAGEVFFKVKASRNIKGTTLEGKQINENRIRYIEVNLDQTSRDLKIVSVYTTKSNEEQELVAWWNNLDNGWRTFFSADIKVSDTVWLKDVVILHNDYFVEENIYSAYGDTISILDTIRVNLNRSRMLPEVRRILRREEINISNVAGIYDLKPLDAFTGLKHLNISGARIPDLEPIRNLSKLESLLAGKSLISSLEPVRYIPNMRELDISGTLVADLSPLADFEALEVLDLTDSRVRELSALNKLLKLRELYLEGLQISNIDPVRVLASLEVLELSGMPVDSITAIKGLGKLKRLALDRTQVKNIDDAAGLLQLEFIFLDNTEVSSLAPLENLQNLKTVYCDKTQVTKSAAIAFMQKRPTVKVIYESQELMAWWDALGNDWKEVFSGLVNLSNPPSREQLHEVSFIKSLDISGKSLINTITPLEKLSSLTTLDISNTAVKDLAPLAGLFDLQTLRMAHTGVMDLGPLSGLTGLKEINLAGSHVTLIEPLTKLPDLRSVVIDSTKVSDAVKLAKLKRLETVYADGVDLMNETVKVLWDSLPQVLVIYQTPALEIWWKALPTDWKGVFSKYEAVSEIPDRVQLHKVASLKEVDISTIKGINSLAPVSMLLRLETFSMPGLQITDISPMTSLTRLKSVDLSNTPVSSLLPLSASKNLTVLNCSNSPVSDLMPISGFTKLEKLNISGTQVTKLDPIAGCTSLKELDCYNTRINNLKALEGLSSIKLLRAYNTKLSERKIVKFKELHPDAEVVFY